MAFGSSDETLQIVIKARDDASRVLKDFQGKVESMKPTFQKMAVAGTAAFVGLGIAMKSALDEGVESKSVDMAFQRMSQTAGIEGNKLISKLQEISKNTVSTTDLMLASNKAMALGVGKDMETITKLMEIARVKGQNMGITTTQAFNDIVTGIGRGSPLILDNLGITIKLGAAQEEYAKKLGKSVEELTDVEMKQALLNSVLSSGTEELKALGDVALTPAERMQQLSAQMSNMRSELGEALIPVAEKLVEVIGPIVTKITEWADKNPELAAKIAVAALAITGLVAVLGTIGLILPAVITGFTALATIVGILLGPVGLIIAALAAVAAVGWLVYKNWEEITAFAGVAWQKIKDTVSGAMEGIMNVITTIGDAIGKAFWTFVNFYIGAWATLFDYLVPGWDTALVAMFNKAQEIFTVVKDFFVKMFGELREIFSASLTYLSDLWSGIWTTVKDVFTQVWASITSVFETASSAITSQMETLMKPIQKVIDLAERAIELAGGAVSSFKGKISSTVQSILDRGSSITGKAIGGPVSMRTPYLVGEHGPELFVPHTSGSITPNGQLQGGGGQTFVININNPKMTTYEDIRLVKQQFEQALRAVVRDRKLETV